MPIEQRWKGQSFHCQSLTDVLGQSLKPAGAAPGLTPRAALLLAIPFCFGDRVKNEKWDPSQ